MYITIPITRTNDDGYKVDANGLTNLSLRIAPFTSDNYSLTAVPNENGIYETTQSVTASGTYQLFNNGVLETSWGGTNGKYLFSDSNHLNVDDFNVGETLIVANVNNQKSFVGTSLTGAVSDSVISSISASLIAQQPKVWIILANITDAGGDSVDLQTTTYKTGHSGITIKVQQLDRSDVNPGSYLIYTLPNAPLFNNKTFITFSEIADDTTGGYVYEPYYIFPSGSVTDIGFKVSDSTGTPCNPTKQVLIKIEVWP